MERERQTVEGREGRGIRLRLLVFLLRVLPLLEWINHRLGAAQMLVRGEEEGLLGSLTKDQNN